MGELLGFVLYLSAGTFQVPQRRVEYFCLLLENIVPKGYVASARQLSLFTGLLASMGLALGRVVCTATSSIQRLVRVHSICRMMLWLPDLVAKS